MPANDPHTMACMEVWGGNSDADVGVSMLGLEGWVYCKPYGRGGGAGGDLHYVTSCASGSISRVLLADVSGHGREAAELASNLRQIMRRNVNRIDQRRVLSSINDQFKQLGPESSFATALVLTFFAPRQTLTLSNAGHPPPLFFSHRDKTWSLLGRDDGRDGEFRDLPLGLFDETNYGQRTIRLGPNDMVLCYSDALIEAARPNGRQIGPARLLELARTLPVDDPQRSVHLLLDRLRGMARLDNDDLTVILIRRNADAVRVPVGRLITAPVKVLWAGLKRDGARLRPQAS